MPSFAEVQAKLAATSAEGAVDKVRRGYLAELSSYTKRPTILYAASPSAPPELTSISRSDVGMFMAALVGVKGEAIDVILHSGGGEAEAAEQIVHYLRDKFRSIRVIVPQHAMSAATMISCAADEIVMGRHSALGPIDPQILFVRNDGRIAVPAKSIIDEFVAAQNAIKAGDPPHLWAARTSELPIGFLVHCQKLMELSKKLVSGWLEKFMFAGDPEAKSKADAVAKWLSDNDGFLTHGRPIHRESAREHGLKIVSLEEDSTLQDLVLSVFHAMSLTFQTAAIAKIVENDQGKGQLIQFRRG